MNLTIKNDVINFGKYNINMHEINYISIINKDDGYAIEIYNGDSFIVATSKDINELRIQYGNLVYAVCHETGEFYRTPNIVVNLNRVESVQASIDLPMLGSQRNLSNVQIDFKDKTHTIVQMSNVNFYDLKETVADRDYGKRA